MSGAKPIFDELLKIYGQRSSDALTALLSNERFIQAVQTMMVKSLEFRNFLQKAIKAAFEQLNLPTKEDFATLSKYDDEFLERLSNIEETLLKLDEKIDKLQQEQVVEKKDEKTNNQKRGKRLKVVSFINEKGGTAKTTLAANFAAYFALKRRKKVLLIDLDSQGHAGKSLGVDVRQAELTIFDVMSKPTMNPAKAVLNTGIKKLDIICSNKRLADFPEVAAGSKTRELRLKKAIERLEPLGYHYVFIDSPPSAGLVTTNILAASTDVVVPVALTYLALDGCAEVISSIRDINSRIKEAKPKLGMVVPTMYRNTKLANEIVSKLSQYFPNEISKTLLGFSVRIDEAQSFGKTIWEYDPKGRGAVMLGALAVELYNKVLR